MSEKSQTEHASQLEKWATSGKEGLPPVLAATVILLRDTADGIETLMLRRNSKIVFGGMWVFPGGRLDPEDWEGIPEDDDLAASRVAAEREAMEAAEAPEESFGPEQPEPRVDIAAQAPEESAPKVEIAAQAPEESFGPEQPEPEVHVAAESPEESFGPAQPERQAMEAAESPDASFRTEAVSEASTCTNSYSSLASSGVHSK